MAKKSIFASSPDGSLFVKLSAVMHPFCALFDGLPVTYFGKEKHGYLDVDTAIAWCKKEMEYHDKDKYLLMIAVMEKVKIQEGNAIF